jgi:TatD DNase family protein
VIETDGPWPYSGEFAGRPTEPTFLRRVVEAVAMIKGMAPADMEDIIITNTRRLFRLW